MGCFPVRSTSASHMVSSVYLYIVMQQEDESLHLLHLFFLVFFARGDVKSLTKDLASVCISPVVGQFTQQQWHHCPDWTTGAMHEVMPPSQRETESCSVLLSVCRRTFYLDWVVYVQFLRLPIGRVYVECIRVHTHVKHLVDPDS